MKELDYVGVIPYTYECLPIPYVCTSHSRQEFAYTLTHYLYEYDIHIVRIMYALCENIFNIFCTPYRKIICVSGVLRNIVCDT